jgi:2,3-bisphosphoglycerate-dependent phosphoglycerate mutase
MAARLCMVRHGETAWNAEGRVQGQLDIPLSAAGLAQAQSVAAALPSGRFSALYSSDLARVRQTAQPAAEKLGLEVRVEACLRERHYGAFQGLTYVQAKESLPADYARFKAKDPQFAFGSGESLSDFFARAMQCIGAIAMRHDGEEVLVFTHGGVLEMAYRHASGCGLSSPRRCELPNAALNWIEVGEREWTVLGWADCAHLAAALDDLAE